MGLLHIKRTIEEGAKHIFISWVICLTFKKPHPICMSYLSNVTAYTLVAFIGWYFTTFLVRIVKAQCCSHSKTGLKKF